MSIKKMMKQMQDAAQKIQGIQQEISSRNYEGVSGGGLVKIVIDGNNSMNSINIDKSILKEDEKEVLEDLIVAAYTDAKQKASKDSENSMSGMLGGVVPPGFKMPF
jgi:nucleoid-associated protein EbfC